jgi:hypothetical protein
VQHHEVSCDETSASSKIGRWILENDLPIIETQIYASYRKRCVTARKRLGEAFDRVGDIGRPSGPGSCSVRHVASLGESVKEWSAQEG